MSGAPRPGPWRVSGASVIVDADGIEIAHEAPGLGMRGEATMGLIAAAPALLAVAGELIRWDAVPESLRGSGWAAHRGRLVAQARAAHTEATGLEQPRGAFAPTDYTGEGA